MSEQKQSNNTQTASMPNGKSRRGFASMDRERHKLVSSRGGKSPRSKNEERLIQLTNQQERTLPS